MLNPGVNCQQASRSKGVHLYFQGYRSYNIVEVRIELQEFVSMNEFQKLDLRVARIVTATRMPGAEKLLLLEVDLGTEKRTSVAAIAKYYSPEELVGKLVVFLANLQPAKIRGIESSGMLLAGLQDDVLALMVPDKDVKPGTKVT